MSRFGLIKAGLLQEVFPEEMRVFWMGSGFGLVSFTSGTAVIGFHLADGDNTRYSIHDFERVATEQEVQDAWSYYEKHRSLDMKGRKIPPQEFEEMMVKHRAYLANAVKEIGEAEGK